MKKRWKLLYLCLIISTLTMLVACKGNENIKTMVGVDNMNASVFEEEFYEDIKAISIMGTEKVIEDKEIIDKIINLIINVEHTVSEKDIMDYYGTTVLVMLCEDGTSRTVSMTSEMILDNGQTYSVKKDICSEIREYFED